MRFKCVIQFQDIFAFEFAYMEGGPCTSVEVGQHVRGKAVRMAHFHPFVEYAAAFASDSPVFQDGVSAGDVSDFNSE